MLLQILYASNLKFLFGHTTFLNVFTIHYIQPTKYWIPDQPWVVPLSTCGRIKCMYIFPVSKSPLHCLSEFRESYCKTKIKGRLIKVFFFAKKKYIEDPTSLFWVEVDFMTLCLSSLPGPFSWEMHNDLDICGCKIHEVSYNDGEKSEERSSLFLLEIHKC